MSVLSSVISNCIFGMKMPGVKSIIPKAFGSMWRYPDCSPMAAWPNHKPELTHHKHRRRRVKPFSEGVFKQTRMRIVDNSKIGMEAISMGRPPMVIQVYSHRQTIFFRRYLSSLFCLLCFFLCYMKSYQFSSFFLKG